MTVVESPVAVPATPESAGVVLLVELPFAGCVSVTAGGTLSVVVAA